MSTREVRRFNTINGVFLPCILSLFGVILFLRTGWVVGNAGLLNALLILLISTVISFCTGLSVATLSTNIEVGTGGTYYIISRNLGLDTGGAIGIPLYLSQAISISFYIIGFLESISFIKPHINFALWGTIILVLFSILVFIGADLAVRFQYLIAALLFIGILSVMLTPWRPPLKVNLQPHYAPGLGFWSVFAVFFPALIGIDAGIGLSGELKEPAKNIPLGIILALCCSTLIYALLMYKAAGIARYDVLITHTDIFIKKAHWPFLVIIGIWAATISSALTYSLAAPRTLKALATDGVLPKFLASSMGSAKGEPRLGVIVTFVIAEAFILTSSLNKVASVITMFFLISYSTLNLAAALQGIVANPTYRPSFKLPWYVSALGFIMALLAMFFIEPVSATIALLAIIVIYTYLKRQELTQTWGDVRTGFWIALSRFGLLQLEKRQLDPTSWRPNLMAFSGNPQTRFYLAQLAHWLSRGNGIVTLFNLIVGQPHQQQQQRQQMLEELRNFIRTHKWPLFAEVEIVNSLLKDIPVIVQAHGIGNLHSNVVLFGWGHDPQKENILMNLIANLVYLGKDILILKFDPQRQFGNYQHIDIWWGGKGGNVELMLLLADILKKNDIWQNAHLRVLRVINNAQNAAIAQKAIANLLKQVNVKAEIKILVEGDVKFKLPELLKTHSAEADLVIMGLPIPKAGEENAAAERINQLISPLGSVLLVRSVNEKEFFMKE